MLQILYPFTVTLPIHQFYAKKSKLKTQDGFPLPNLEQQICILHVLQMM